MRPPNTSLLRNKEEHNKIRENIKDLQRLLRELIQLYEVINNIKLPLIRRIQYYNKLSEEPLESERQKIRDDITFDKYTDYEKQVLSATKIDLRDIEQRIEIQCEIIDSHANKRDTLVLLKELV